MYKVKNKSTKIKKHNWKLMIKILSKTDQCIYSENRSTEIISKTWMERRYWIPIGTALISRRYVYRFENRFSFNNLNAFIGK